VTCMLSLIYDDLFNHPRYIMFLHLPSCIGHEGIKHCMMTPFDLTRHPVIPLSVCSQSNDSNALEESNSLPPFLDMFFAAKWSVPI
jgi:hypothetical protein